MHTHAHTPHSCAHVHICGDRAHAHAHTHTHTHTHTRAHAHVHTHAHTHVCAYTGTRAYTHARMHFHGSIHDPSGSHAHQALPPSPAVPAGLVETLDPLERMALAAAVRSPLLAAVMAHLQRVVLTGACEGMYLHGRMLIPLPGSATVWVCAAQQAQKGCSKGRCMRARAAPRGFSSSSSPPPVCRSLWPWTATYAHARTPWPASHPSCVCGRAPAGRWELCVAASQALAKIAVRSPEPYRIQAYSALTAFVQVGVGHTLPSTLPSIVCLCVRVCV